ncbi:MAG TPA: radical SAM protein [Planctomycetota bacterium]|nr:radical SAM protein [Planctomycetota bacterium]
MGHVFGPVPSRRLGRSLGVDLVPHKTCTYDCLYCQVGCTTHNTLERKEWVPLEEVTRDLAAKLDTHPDYVTLSGSGEPTLYSRIGELIDRIREMTDTPVALITNGSLLWRPELRRELMKLDLVLPSLDAADETMFRRVNRPHEALSFEQVLGGLIDFRREFAGKYWLEVFLLAGLTDTPAEVSKLAACAKRIGPDKVQLNTVTRPPAEDFATPVSPERMVEFAAMFDPPAEVIAGVPRERDAELTSTSRDAVLEMLRRRPCSLDDVVAGLDLHRTEAVKLLAELEGRGEVAESRVGRVVYYRAL